MTCGAEKTLAGTVLLSAENTVWHAVFWQEPAGSDDNGCAEPKAGTLNVTVF
jgi:hypothetical protein